MTTDQTDAPLRTGRTLLSKVPEASAVFWITKALTTGMGESASDFFVHRFPPAAAVAGGGVAFAVGLLLQLRARRYLPGIYWFAVAMVGIFGTMAADVLHVGLHVPYLASAAFFSASLAAVFLVWYRTEGTLSIHSITTTRRELFYWATVVTTFALGTAVGDLTAISLHLGYFGSAVMFGAVILLPAIAYWILGASPIVTFWAAYVLTRPFGASIADWMGVPHDRGGLAFGAGRVSIAAAAAIVVFVIGLTVATRRADAVRR